MGAFNQPQGPGAPIPPELAAALRAQFGGAAQPGPPAPTAIAAPLAPPPSPLVHSSAGPAVQGFLDALKSEFTKGR